MINLNCVVNHVFWVFKQKYRGKKKRRYDGGRAINSLGFICKNIKIVRRFQAVIFLLNGGGEGLFLLRDVL